MMPDVGLKRRQPSKDFRPVLRNGNVIQNITTVNYVVRTNTMVLGAHGIKRVIVILRNPDYAW